MAFLERNANRGSISTGFNIDNSLKCQANSGNESMYRSPTSGNRRTFTISFWFKRTQLSGFEADPYLMGQGDNARFHFAGDTLRWMFDGNSTELEAAGKLRDVGAWYHIVIAVDTTQGTNTNRIKAYVNGLDYPFSNSDWPSQNAESQWGHDQRQFINIKYANNNTGDGSYDNSGYYSEFCWIDGQQLPATDFGEFDEDSAIWKPKDVSGLTFGSEGYYLKFDDSSALGADSSGNSNNFTLVNIDSTNQATDTPTNNFATINVIWGADRMPLISEGATEIGNNVNAYRYAPATMGVTSGKWYWEIKPTVDGNTLVSGAGIASNQTTLFFYDETGNFVYHYDGDRYVNGTATSSYGAAWATNNIIGFAYDADNWTLTCYVNNSSQGNLLASQTDISSELFIPYVYSFGTHTYQTNFGGYTTMSNTHTNTDENGYGSFVYAPPSGYYALCTKNLAEYG